MESLPCFICNTYTESYRRNLLEVKSAHSNTPISDQIVNLTKQNAGLEEYIADVDSESWETEVVCVICLEQIDEYDLMCATTQQIEQRFQDLMVHMKLGFTDNVPSAIVEESIDNLMFEEDDFGNNYQDDDDELNIDCPNRMDSVKQEKSHGLIVQAQSPTSANNCKICRLSMENIDIVEHEELHSKSFFRFQCVICLKGNKSTRSLVKHVESQHKKNPGTSRCSICHFIMKTQASIQEHMLLHDNDMLSGFPCVLCKTDFKTWRQLFYHVDTNHNQNEMSFKDIKAEAEDMDATQELSDESMDKNYDPNPNPNGQKGTENKCKICLLSLDSKAKLTKHNELHEAALSFQCVLCLNTYRHRESLTRHVFYQHKANPNDYSCFLCHFQPLCEATIKEHILLHRQHSKLQCVFCKNNFISKVGLTKHIRVNHIKNQRKLRCGICLFDLFDQKELEKHLRLHEQCKPTKCVICEMSFDSICERNRHTRKHYLKDTKDVKCIVCNYVFRAEAEESIVDHMDLHKKLSPLHCVFCEIAFPQKTGLQNHVLNTHIKGKLCRMKCNICTLRLASWTAYTKHIKLHSKFKPTECVVCKKSFSHVEERNQHMDLHSKQLGIVQCHRCGRHFGNATRLKNHMVTHTGAKDFQCDICKRLFSLKHKLKQHILVVHVQKKPFACGKCGKTFAAKGNMRCHERTHLGVGVGWYEKIPCTFNFCDRTFTRKTKLREHLEKDHETMTHPEMVNHLKSIA